MSDAADKTNKSILFFTDDWGACAWYRCYVPGVELKRLGYEVVLDQTLRPEDVDRFDVIVFQRKTDERSLEIIKVANSAGKLTVYEIDDDVWNVARTNPGAGTWTQTALSGLARCAGACQLVTTASEVLAQRLRRINPHVRVLPNSLPADSWDYPKPKEQREDRVVLGWAGSSSHVEDLRIISEVVQQLVERYPQVEFVFAGGPDDVPLTLGNRVRRLEATDIRRYPEVLEQIDVGVIPLQDTAFNRAKSDLKFVEYSMLGIPSVASKVEPYLKSVKHGENGFLAVNAKDWLKFLGRLVENVELRREIGARAQAFARTRTIDRTIAHWIRAYKLGGRPGADG